MKIFISYGHGDHTQVVDLLFDALIREGHEPWKDDRYEGRSGIPAGRDFTELIYKTIDESDFVIAFVTNITKDKPYCRDERQYAYNQKGTHFIQIRMDYAEITLGNARSYIDMSDVIGGNGQIIQRLFEDKLKSLLAAFRDPDSFAEGGFTPWAKFDTHLKVPGALKYQEFIASLDGDDFVGRQWLVDKCKNWVMDTTVSCRLFVILGEAGTGKTAFVRRLAEDEELVRSVHVCVYDRPSTRTARDTLKDLAYVLSQNNSSYFEILKTRNLEKLQNMTVDGLFEFLFIEPLKNETQKYLLVIDGLDEMEETTGFKQLIKLFRQYAQQINPNISFLLTGRPDAYITDALKTLPAGQRMERVILDKNVSRNDLLLYIEKKLKKLGCYSKSLADKLLAACDGNFEYLSLLFREAQEVGVSVLDGTKIPYGLNERYAQYLDRRMETAGQSRLKKQQRWLLSVLCAAYEPMPVSVLAAVTELDEYEVEDELELFGSLIRRISTDEEEPRICLFTKSFRDFLLSKTFDKYAADHKLGTRLLAQYMTEKCATEKALRKFPYLDQYGFVHLLQHAAQEPDAVTDYCKTLASSGADLGLRIANALHLGETATIHSYWQVRKNLNLHEVVIQQLKGRRSTDALTEIVALMREQGDVANALILEADVMLWNPSPAVMRQVEENYAQALNIYEKRHAAAPDRRTRRDIGIVYVRLGDLERKAQTTEGDERAERWFQLALELYEQNHQESPCDKSSMDLAKVYSRLGGVAKHKYTPEADEDAAKWIQKALELYEKKHEDCPSYESRRNLTVVYEHLGDLAARKLTPEGNAEAERWYLKMLVLDEQKHKENPCYQSRRDLALTYGRLAALASRKMTAEGNEESERRYRQALELYEQNHQENPSYESRRGLSTTYNRLGDLAIRRNTPEGYVQAGEWFHRMRTANEQNYRTNPGYESRRSLAIAYSRCGDVELRKGTTEGTAEGEKWHRKAQELYEQNYKENPCEQSKNDLSVTYGRLALIARRKDTLEGQIEVQIWENKRKALNAQ